MLARSVTFELLESIPGWYSQILERLRSVHDQQLSKRRPLETPWNRAALLAMKELLALFVAEAPDHRLIVTRLAINVKRYECGQLESLADWLIGGSLAPLITHLMEEKKLSRAEIEKLRRILDESTEDGES